MVIFRFIVIKLISLGYKVSRERTIASNLHDLICIPVLNDSVCFWPDNQHNSINILHHGWTMSDVFSIATHARCSVTTRNQRSPVIDLPGFRQTPGLSLKRELFLEFATRRIVWSAKETVAVYFYTYGSGWTKASTKDCQTAQELLDLC